MPRLSHSTERGRETQRALRDALMQLILEKGFDAVTVRDITERAGIDRTTFYLHASDKRELLERSQRQMMDELFAGWEAGRSLRERTQAGFRAIAEHGAAYRVLLATADAETNHRLQSHLAEHIERVVRARTEARGQQPEISTDLLATYAASVLRGLARWWLEHEMPYSPDEMAEIFQRLIQGGFSAFQAEDF